MKGPSEKFLAMFSVAGDPFECLGEYDSREEAHQRCQEEATHWRFRSDWFVKVEQTQEHDS